MGHMAMRLPSPEGKGFQAIVRIFNLKSPRPEVILLSVRLT